MTRRTALKACVAGFAVLWLAPRLAFAQERFVLASGGQPRAELVMDDKEASGPLLFAIQEFQRYVRQMSRASLPVVKAPSGGPAIIITANPETAVGFGAASFTPRGEDHYRLHVTGKRVFVVGATPRAALYGVYDLLERLGCGWCVPGDDAVPLQETPALPELDVDTAPAFKYRMMLDFPMMSVAQSVAIADWIAKNRMNWIHPCENAHGEPKLWYERREKIVPEIQRRGLHLIFGGHTMHTWLPEEYFKEHPDWFACNDGERKPPTLCVTNGDMTAELIRNMRRFLDRCPEVEVVDLWHPDGTVFCHCAVCTRGLVPADANGKKPEATPADAVQSSYVISYMDFMNRVATEVGKSHPRVMVSPLIYGPSDRAMPDGCPMLADNLLPGLAHIFRDSYRPLAGEPRSAINMRFLGDDLTWMAKSKHHYIYEYYHCWSAPFVYPGARVIVRDLQIFKEVGCQGTSSDMYGYSPINMYVAARALWSPDISWEAAVRDFNTRYYGDAGKEMGDNWVELENGIYGKAGYQANGALEDHWKWIDPACGKWLNEQRPRQVKLLEDLIARTKDPLVKVRLERALKPWKLWNAEPRWWALPAFETSTQPAR